MTYDTTQGDSESLFFTQMVWKVSQKAWVASQTRPSLAVVGRKKILSIATMLGRFLDLLGSMLSIFEKILLGKF